MGAKVVQTGRKNKFNKRRLQSYTKYLKKRCTEPFYFGAQQPPSIFCPLRRRSAGSERSAALLREQNYGKQESTNC